MRPARQATTAQAMHGVRWQFHSIFTEPTPLSAFSSLDLPTTLLVGERTPESSRGVSRLLSTTLPNVTTVELQGMAHMAPVTHPDVVKAIIEEHLARLG